MSGCCPRLTSVGYLLPGYEGLDEEIDIRFPGVLKVGCRTSKVNLVDQVLVLEVEEVDGHLAADHFDVSLQTEIA